MSSVSSPAAPSVRCPEKPAEEIPNAFPLGFRGSENLYNGIVKKRKQKLHGEPRHLQLFKPDFWVTLPTLIVAFESRSLAATVLTGMALFCLYTRLFP
jgi:hypothetical protein